MSLETERSVLEVYQKVNPSVYNIEDSEEVFHKNQSFTEQLYCDSLKLLPQVFSGARLLEFGPGTGERSICFQQWGARSTYVEINEQAIERARFLFDRFVPDASYEFVQGSLFDFTTEDLFDITVSMGVLHHTENKEAAFKQQVSFLKPGGINILGIGNTGGAFQRNLQRLIIYTFAGNNVEEIVKIAEELFKEHLDRAQRLGGRTRKAIIYDTYVNPKVNGISINELLRWYRKYKLKFYSSWPQVTPSILGDNLGGQTDWRNFPELLSRPEWIWATQNQDDEFLCRKLEQQLTAKTSLFRKLSEKANDVRSDKIHPSPIRSIVSEIIDVESVSRSTSLENIRMFEPWLREVDQVLESLELKDFEACSAIIHKSEMLFRGRCGLGMTYYAAIKE